VSTTERTPSGPALFLELAAWGIPVDNNLETYDLSRLDSQRAIDLILRARRDAKQLRDVLVADDENMWAVGGEGRA
jgi:hypothetical protein